MTTITPDSRGVPLGEPKPIVPPLASFYSHTRELAWLIVRLTAGGMLLVHGIMKIMPAAEKGLAATVEAFAAGSLARRAFAADRDTHDWIPQCRIAGRFL